MDGNKRTVHKKALGIHTCRASKDGVNLVKFYFKQTLSLKQQLLCFKAFIF